MEDTSLLIEVDLALCGDDAMITHSLEGEAPTMGPLTDEDLEKIAYEKKQRRKTSPIWNEFVIVEVGGVNKPQCK
jgi:hypothetical protein